MDVLEVNPLLPEKKNANPKNMKKNNLTRF